MNDRKSIRREMRARRRAVTPMAAERHARGVARRLLAQGPVRHARHIAVYLPNDGEVSLNPLIRRLWRMHKRCYLPVLFGKRLWFYPYRRHDRLRPNRFAIPEPRVHPRKRRHLAALDVVLTPLVAFDGAGNRLGMGGGFYDRTFAYLGQRRRWRRPIILGVAHAFQEVEALPAQPWDVPLSGIVTERELRLFPAPPPTPSS